jgi:cell division protease FtsH
VCGIVDECFAQARDTLREHRAQLDAIVERLLERETLDEAEVYAAAGIPRDSAEPGAATPAAAQAAATARRRRRESTSAGGR